MSPLLSAARTDLERSYLSEVIQKYTFWRPQTDRVFEFARGFGKNQDPVILPPRFVPRRLLAFPGDAAMHSVGPDNGAAENLDPLEALKKGDFALLGEPGTGKTALLWHLLYRCALYPLIGGRIRLPIGVDLARYNPPTDSILEFIRRDLLLTSEAKTGALQLPAHGELALHLDDYMSEGRLVLLFDGLDALPEPVQTRCIAGLQTLRETYGDIRLVVSISSEELGSRLVMPRFVLRDLDAAAQQELIDINFPDPDLARREGAFAKLEPYGTLRANPFMLLVMGAVLKDNRRVSGSRARLCQSFVQSLLALAAQASARPLPSEKAQVRALGNLALAIRTEFSPGAWVPRSFALERLADNNGSSENAGAREAEELLRSGIQSGLLYESGDGLISFSHQLLQDYIAATALKRAHPGSARMNRVIRDPRSAGLLEMVAGLEPDAIALVEHILPFDPLLAARCAAASPSLNMDLRVRIAGELAKRLQSSVTAERLRAAEALIALSPESALSVLVPWLRGAAGPEQALAEGLVNRLPPKLLLPGVQALLADEDPWKRAWGLRTLRGKKFDWPLQTIAQLVSDQDPAVRVEAAATVACLPGERGIQHLARLLQDEEDVVRKAAAKELVHFRPVEIVPNLVSSYTRPWARGNRTESDASVQEAWLPSLASLLRDNLREVRYVVAEMLVAWDGPDPLPHLVRLLAEQDQNQEISWLAAQIVGRRKTEGAVPTLLSLLAGDAPAKTLAIGPLARILGPSAAPHLIPLLADEDWYVRTSALRALGEAGATAAIPQVIALLQDRDADVRALAAAALAELDARGAVRDLVRALRDPEGKVRAAAARALHALSPGDLLDCVRPLLDDPDPRARRAAAEALAPTAA